MTTDALQLWSSRLRRKILVLTSLIILSLTYYLWRYSTTCEPSEHTVEETISVVRTSLGRVAGPWEASALTQRRC
jgi:hypothetical protein